MSADLVLRCTSGDGTALALDVGSAYVEVSLMVDGECVGSVMLHRAEVVELHEELGDVLVNLEAP